jgi:SAM-dependent methyltransferase
VKCRLCKSPILRPIVDLGFTPPADQFLRESQLCEPEISYPLRLCLCSVCNFAQLDHVVDPRVLYQRDYPYEASVTRAGHAHWTDFARDAVARLKLGADDLVVDVGSNVGVLLAAFRDEGVRILGIDPAPNIARIAQDAGIDTICDFIGATVAERIVQERGRASLVTATNVFAHVDDLDAMIEALLKLLKDDGVFVFEAPYFRHLLEMNEYDTIYHEHLSYIALRPLVPFFEKFDLEMFEIVEADIHGGSIRVFVGRKARRPIAARLRELLESEKSLLHPGAPLITGFSSRVERNRAELTWLLHSLRHDNKTIAAVSAPAKGMTLLNYCGIGTNLLDFVTEKSKLKIGRFTPGSHIPVLADDALLERKPDYALLLAWNFADEIMKNLEGYRRMGGKFIIPIPSPRIVE